jgi:hypothetical protein
MRAHHHHARQPLDAVAARYRPVWDAMEEAARRDASLCSPQFSHRLLRPVVKMMLS